MSFSCTMLRDQLIPDIYCNSHRHISYLTLTWIHLILVMPCLTLDIWHRYLPCYTYYLISDTGICYAMFITWYLIPVLTMLYLLCDIWYRYLPCYTYYLISDTGTCHAMLITWYLTPVLVMLSPVTSTLDLILWHLYYITYSSLLLLRGLGMIIILLSDIWYSCTLELLYSWTPEKGWLLILYSY